jgi:hypothetical protein
MKSFFIDHNFYEDFFRSDKVSVFRKLVFLNKFSGRFGPKSLLMNSEDLFFSFRHTSKQQKKLFRSFLMKKIYKKLLKAKPWIDFFMASNFPLHNSKITFQIEKFLHMNAANVNKFFFYFPMCRNFIHYENCIALTFYNYYFQWARDFWKNISCENSNN